MLNKKNSDILEFISAVKGDDYLRVEEDLGQGYVKLKVTEAEKRQARHDIRNLEDALLEMLRNCRDAGASRIFVASSRTTTGHTLNILDNGQGIPAEITDRVFEPRVTSKLNKVVEDRYGIHGRGMALFAIRSAVSELTLVGRGGSSLTNFKILNCIEGLPEKKDQSTFPTVKILNGQVQHVVGIRNIPRILTEFVLDNDIDVLYGSHTEIAAEIFKSYGQSDKNAVEKTTSEQAEHKIKDLKKLIDLLAFDISPRNQYRIIESSACRKKLGVSDRLREVLQGEFLSTSESSAGASDNVIVVRGSKNRGATSEDLSSRLSIGELNSLAEQLETSANEYLHQKYLIATSTVVRRHKGKLVLQFELYDQE